MSMSAVHIIQKVAPSELTYAVDSDHVYDFLEQWRAENGENYLHAQIMPLLHWNPGETPIPVQYGTNG